MSNHQDEKEVILIIDDSANNLNLLFDFLSQFGYEVLVAQDGETALHRAESVQPDIILLDVIMPGIDGFETCRRLKHLKATQNIPVIFMTALVDIESKLKAFAVGAVDYITKPFERREVLARIKTHLTIRHLQQNLEAQIAERERAEQKLREYMDELEERNKELDAFAHTVAHDLKNPLGSITGIATILETMTDSLSPEALKHHLRTLAQSGRKAGNIVEELLILATVRMRDVKSVPLQMEDIAMNAEERLVDMIAISQAEIIHPPHWPVVMGYAPWIEEVWVNYLSNAIKYGGDPPRIELGASEAPNQMIRYWVKDNGPGLSAKAQLELFTPFSRVSEVRAQGHGLGLSIVRRIVEKLGGKVGVESQGISGQGCTFSFTLPTPEK